MGHFIHIDSFNQVDPISLDKEIEKLTTPKVTNLVSTKVSLQDQTV